MSHFIQQGTTIDLIGSYGVVHNSLPVGNYVVKELRGKYYLSTADEFVLPTRFYGKHDRYVSRVMDKFTRHHASVGVLLSGTKGSGKSLLAKSLSAKCAAQGMPTLMVNERHIGDDFVHFLQSIDQPCVVIFDEFEKVYSYEEQAALLTMFDGTMSSKKLWILTCNHLHNVNEFMINRPGRVHYRIEYSTLDDDFIREYCAEHLKDMTQLTPLCSYARLFNDFNFDMLQALVAELNDYNCTVADASEILNVRPVFRNDADYEAVVSFTDGSEPKVTTWWGDPMREPTVVIHCGDDDNYTFHMAELTKTDRKSGVYEYETAEKKLRLTVTNNMFDYKNVF